jgi:CHAT domain-containing protein
MMRNWLLGGAIGVLCCGAVVVELSASGRAVAQAVDARKGEADRLFQQGRQQYKVSQFEAAFQSWQRALRFYREIKDRQGEKATLGNLGLAYQALGNYIKAIEYHEQSLVIARKIKERQGEGATLGNLGIAYAALGNYDKAVEYQEKYLVIAREIKDRRGEGKALGNLGIAYAALGNYDKAIEYEQQWLTIAREIKDRQSEGAALGNLGIAYYFLGNYAKAIEYEQQQLTIAREIKDRQSEGAALGNLGLAYHSLGNYNKAIEYAQQQLTIARAIKDRQSEGKSLGNLGLAHHYLGNYAKAIEYYEQRLVIAREIKDRQGEGVALGNLGIVYYSLGNYAKAIEYQEQSLLIAREIKDRQGKGATLGNLGAVYTAMGNYAKAIKYYEQRLVIAREIKDRNGEQIAFNNIGVVLKNQNRLDLAILFYKQSVNVSESIRQDNRLLSRELQASYIETVAGTYRNLADLLLSQGRIGEAQKVLELLKIQEINDITQGTRSPSTLTQVTLTQIEQSIIKKHNSLIAFGQQRDTCKQTNCPQLEEYNQSYRTITDAYEKFIEDIKTQLIQERDKAIAASTDDFTGGARKIVDHQPNTILIYPLVLKDKTHILWASKGGVLSQTECSLGEAQLSKLTEQFRTALQTSDDLNPVQKAGKNLYQCLLPEKLRTELTQNKIKNLVFVPDRITNYIPMAALYDGTQYLIEQFAVSNILSASLTDTQDRLPDRPSVLGFGLSQAVTLTNPTRNFGSLPFVPYELESIIKKAGTTSPGIFPGSTWLNSDFSQKTLENKLFNQKPNILHIATHGEFLPTSPKASYLLLGDGTPYEISKIQYLEDLQNVHLVVLSACETALGGSDRNGLEVAGIAAYFLSSNAKAKAVLASLWKVNDPATSLLMAKFYGTLSTDHLSKAQALQRVQREMITSKLTLQDAANRAGARLYEPNKKRPQNLSHPYYWAPFILIGNSL